MTTATKIGLNVMFLVLGVLLSAQMFGLFPDGNKEKLASRVTMSESVAVQCSIVANRDFGRGSRSFRENKKFKEIQYVLQALVERNEDVLSAGLRLDSGLKIGVGRHVELWNIKDGSRDTDHISVPIVRDKKKWGTVEICFTPLRRETAFLGFSASPLWLAIVAITAATGFGSILYYSRVFNEKQDSNGKVPSRVRSALDTLSDGLLVLDEQEQIVFANRAFEEATGITEENLIGRKVSDLDWSSDWDEVANKEIDEEEARKITLQTGIGGVDFTIGLSNVFDDKGNPQGQIVCFNDVTVLEKRREELLYTMRSLQSSRDMIKEQNEQLKILATRDPLTNCWNRRPFFEELNRLWKESEQKSIPMSAIMLDIDHFKGVNDNHGHAMGDEVLKKVSATVLDYSRENDIVCRYGGEEFCILLPETNLVEAKDLGERFRKQIELLEFENLKVTASQGVSCTVLKANEPEEMLEQADQALYVAKRSGRNRVTSFNDVPADFDLKEAETNTRKTARTEEADEAQAIPFQVVSSMMSVLSHRDPETAAHCVRVADLSFALGQGLLSASDLYALEVGALLHDIGKIAVPDSLLLKPEKLSGEEIQMLRQHSRIGCELVEAAFHATPVVDTVRYAGCPYAGSEKYPGMIKGDQIPLSARIVTIADAFDSMVTDSVYRRRLSREEAIAELYRCAGTQFDPELVERFVDLLKTRPELEGEEERKVQFTKDFAIQLAYISEQITKSFDEQDFDLLRANAQKLEAAANQYKNPKLKIIAAKLINHSVTSDGQEIEIDKIMTDVIQLLELCHSAQQEFLTPAVS